MIDVQVLHDLKRIAEVAKALMEACDALYTDLEAKSSGSVETSHDMFLRLNKLGGKDGL